jgi:hypothetical protein
MITTQTSGDISAPHGEALGGRRKSFFDTCSFGFETKCRRESDVVQHRSDEQKLLVEIGLASKHGSDEKSAVGM